MEIEGEADGSSNASIHKEFCDMGIAFESEIAIDSNTNLVVEESQVLDSLITPGQRVIVESQFSDSLITPGQRLMTPNDGILEMEKQLSPHTGKISMERKFTEETFDADDLQNSGEAKRKNIPVSSEEEADSIFSGS